MQQRAVWIGGFFGGSALGALLLSLDTPTAAPPAASAAAEAPDPVDPVPDFMREPAAQHASGTPTFREMAYELGRSQGGRISLAQMEEIARITGGVGVPSFNELASEVARAQGGEISIAQMSVIARITGDGASAGPYSYAMPERRRTMPRPVLSPDMFMGDVGGSRLPSRPAWDDSTSRHAYSNVDLYDERPSVSSMSPNRLNARNGRPLISTGDGFTSGSDYYLRSGPDGAVNARTGEYTPLTDGM